MYLLGHKKASLALYVQYRDFKTVIFQNATMVCQGNQYPAAPLDKGNRWVLRTLENPFPPEEPVQILLPFENLQQIYLGCPFPHCSTRSALHFY